MRKAFVQTVWMVLALMPIAPAAETADTILYSGDVVTMNPAQPSATAVAIKDGKIVAVGDDRTVLATKGEGTRLVDLAGRCVLPGLIDAHGHVTMVAQSLAAANLASPPAGPVRNIGQLQRTMTDYIANHAVESDKWVLGTGYDESLLEEHRVPNRHDLDAVSREHPIFVLHISGHMGVANSLALEKMGITAATPNPPGGVIGREAGSQTPDGVLQESALIQFVQPALPTPTTEEGLRLLGAAQDLYASYGHTTIQDGATSVAGMNLLMAAAREKALKLDVIAYPAWYDAERIIDVTLPIGKPLGRLKIGGAKLVLDGSPQGKTAWLTHPYLVPPPGKPLNYAGFPAMTDEEADNWVLKFMQRKWQVLAHCNGDAAADQFIAAVAEAESKLGAADRRTVMIHAQTVREDQLDKMQALRIMPSFFPAHVYFWGDWHRDSVLGPERAARISPAQSAIKRSMRFTLHNDPPIVPPDPLRAVWSAVNRVTRSGAVLGPEQRITPYEALKAITIDAAWQNSEEAIKGSLEAGKRADLVILSANPLRIDPQDLSDLKVLETIVEGATVFRRDASSLPQH